MTRRRMYLVPLALVFAVSAGAFAGDEAADPKKKSDGGAETKSDASKGPELAWARSYAEAKDESMERNVAIYIHSHGST